MPIAVVRHLAIGTAVTTIGSVSVQSGAFDAGLAIQGLLDGIYVLDAGGHARNVGDLVQVTGTLVENFGLLSIQPTAITSLGRAPGVRAVRHTTGSVGEATEGRLLDLDGAMVGDLFDDSPFGFKFNIDDGSGRSRSSSTPGPASRPPGWSTARRSMSCASRTSSRLTTSAIRAGRRTSRSSSTANGHVSDRQNTNLSHSTSIRLTAGFLNGRLPDCACSNLQPQRRLQRTMRFLRLLVPMFVAACGSVHGDSPGGGSDANGSGDANPGPDAASSQFPSNGSAGAFAPIANTVLPAGIYQFTTISIPAGVIVTTDGTGVLELRAQGDVMIAGTIDLSGAHGAPSIAVDGAGGGATGNPTAIGANGSSAACPQGGHGGLGALGAPTLGTACAGTNANTSGGFGGGAGGQFQAGGGAGGGGYAGGSGGRGGAGASMDGTGGAAAMAAGLGGQADGGVYAGADATCNGLGGCGAGGGSIGSGALGDLAVATTFRPGSGGGGGSAPVSTQAGEPGGAGGGGGGGALRVATPGAITIAATGVVRADGGAGGRTDDPTATPGGPGGGGSGGVIYLSAPQLTVSGTVSAAGGVAGGPAGIGGAGGLGRIRISALTAQCTLAGTFTPQLASACNPASVAGATYVAVFPN